ncbi:unnamed protein product [Urochloa decumbens]|uniref:Peptidase A1 domain-containing protein n=1 Tax=Urochloa decumbens TaxID=240449 RepID=A0ABC9DRW3_9POAL
MAASHLLFCVILCTSYYLAHGGDEHGFVTVPTRSSEPEEVCSDSRVNMEPSRAAVSVPLVHRHGPCASSQKSDDTPSLTERLGRSRTRANYIKSRASMGTVTTRDDDANITIPAHLGGSVDSLEYVVTVSLGTPSVSQTLLLDTGSDLSWVQCAPCNSTACYPQKDPLFDPSKSSTYALIPCHTDACRNLTADGDGTGCTSGGGAAPCGFFIEYGDESHTTGVYNEETLTLAPGVTVKDFLFGCARDQEGLTGKCLRPTAAPSPTAISVAGKRLDVPPSVFQGGMIIDSGAVLTYLPTTAYKALRAAFRSAMSAYPLLPPNEDLDTCFNLTGFSNVTVPTVALAFDGGVRMDLDVPDGILLEGCLAFQDAGLDGIPGIFGSVNQRTFEVLYDVGHGKLGFRAGAC